jgi:hypothetical protein
MILASATQSLTVLAALALGIVPQQSSNTNTGDIKPAGDYAKIDVQLANNTLKTLTDGTEKQQRATMKQVMASPDKYCPVVLCALSNLLFDDGNKNEAVFWFYAGMLRVRMDAMRCADKTAREGVHIVNQNYGRDIIPYAMQNPAKLKATIARVVEWDRKTPYNYDRRWINLHGMDAIQESMGLNKEAGRQHPPMSMPKEQWTSIANQTRENFVKEMDKTIQEVKTRHNVNQPTKVD